MPEQHASGLILGQRVKHYPSPGSTDYALGFVSAFAMHTAIQTSVMMPDKNFFSIRDGVKWIGDPQIGELDWREGVWDFHPLDLPGIDDLDELTHPMVRQAVERLERRKASDIAAHGARQAAAKKAAETAEKERVRRAALTPEQRAAEDAADQKQAA